MILVQEAPKSASRHITSDDIEDEYGAKDYTMLNLKIDHFNRPLWVVSMSKAVLNFD